MTDERPEGGSLPKADGGRPGTRGINLLIGAGALIVVALAVFGYQRNSRLASPPETAPAPAPAASPAPGAPQEGTPITAQLPIRLSPEASIVAERYRCICSCNDPLNVCTCSKTPGSRDMKQYVQELVDQKKTTQQIDAAMISRYGAGVLIATAAPKPTPARRRR